MKALSTYPNQMVDLSDEVSIAISFNIPCLCLPLLEIM